MSAVTFGGLSSGLDTKSIVNAMMQVERAPLVNLEKRKTINDEKLKAYSEFNDKLKALEEATKELSDPDKLRASRTSTNRDGIISVDSKGLTTEGTYNITVKQLSQVQKDVSTGYDSMSESVLGTGSISISSGGSEHTITIGSDNNNLKDFVASVNSQADKTGVTASIINDGSESGGYRVVFSGKDAASTFSISSSLSGADAPFSVTNSQEAKPAQVVIDGIEIKSSSNTLSNAVPGLDITLDSISEKDSEGNFKPLRLTVETDEKAMKEKVNTFVDAYNGIIEFLNKGTADDSSLNSYLRTDSTVSNLKRQMQGILSSTTGDSGPMVMLSQAGISTTKEGTLSVDSTKLDKALSENGAEFVTMFSGSESTDGVMDKFNSLMHRTTDSIDGLYANKKKSHDSTAKSLETQISRMENRLVRREESLNAQFSAMEELLATMNNQSSYFSSMLLAHNK